MDWSAVMFLSDSHSDGTHSLMQRHISPNLMKKHTHPDLRWTEGEHIFIFGRTIHLVRLSQDLGKNEPGALSDTKALEPKKLPI